MTESETIEGISGDIIDGILKDWVALAYRLTASGLRKPGLHPEDDAARKAIDEMRWLHLAEPWLVSKKILSALKLAGWTPPTGAVAITYAEAGR